jgi:hypothetical protein
MVAQRCTSEERVLLFVALSPDVQSQPQPHSDGLSRLTANPLRVLPVLISAVVDAEVVGVQAGQDPGQLHEQAQTSSPNASVMSSMNTRFIANLLLTTNLGPRQHESSSLHLLWSEP